MNINDSSNVVNNGAYDGKLKEDIYKLIDKVDKREMRYIFPTGFAEQVRKDINTQVSKELKLSIIQNFKQDTTKLKSTITEITKRVKDENNRVIDSLKNVNRVIEDSNERRLNNISKIEKMHYILNGVRDIALIGASTVLLIVGIATSVVLIQDNPDYNFFETLFITLGGILGLWFVVVIFKKLIEWWENR